MIKNIKINKINVSYWFYLFAIVHLLAWTIAPTLIRYNLPLDSMEGATWGHQLQWGYDKNPFLNAWLTRLAVTLSPDSGWVVYLFSQLCIVAAFVAVWKLGKEMLSKAHALVAVMILECIQYYNFHGIDFNDNTLEVALWSLTGFAFYNALKNKSYAAWIMTGVLAALGLMAKYYTLAFIAGMGLLLLWDKNHRKQLATLPPYIGLLFFITIITPHLLWLPAHDYITIKYVFMRGSDGSSNLWNHIHFPAKFIWEQFQAFVPALFIFSFLFLGNKPRQDHSIKLSKFDCDFLVFVGLGPFILTALLSFVGGVYLRAAWGMPLMSFWGIIMVAVLKPRLSSTKLYAFIATIFVLIALFIGGYAKALTRSNSESSANYPGRLIAQTMTERFNQRFNQPLKYVAGSRWVAGNISFYSKDHPAVYIQWDKSFSPWIDEADLKRKGAVFVWEVSEGKVLPPEVRARFPRLEPPRVMTFKWHRNVSKLKPIKIGVAVLPPEK